MNNSTWEMRKKEKNNLPIILYGYFKLAIYP